MAERRTKTIKTDYLARVEGEGGMRVEIENGRVTDVRLRIYEPPRFFEAFLRGRGFMEAPDITARICGICPVAYQMSAVRSVRCAGFSTAASGSKATRFTYTCCTCLTFSGTKAPSRSRATSQTRLPRRSR